MTDAVHRSDRDDAPADIEIRTLSAVGDLRGLVALLNQIWGTVTPVVSVELLRAIEHAGGYTAGAFHGDQLIGGSLGFLARHEGAPALHSHVTGILPGVRHTGVGRAMKRHQRAWAADHDLDWVTWTFDPLVRRNAWFNLDVLRAEVHDYLVDFYGPLDDAVNQLDESDRLLVAWSTTSDAPEREHRGASDIVAVPTPEDIVVLRRTDPAAAIAWRHRLRDELGDRIAAGARVVGFTRDGNYLLTR